MYCCWHFSNKLDDLVFCMYVQKCQFYLGLFLDWKHQHKLFLFDQIIIFNVFDIISSVLIIEYSYFIMHGIIFLCLN